MKKTATRFVALLGLFVMGAIPALAQVSVQLYWNNNRPYYWDSMHHRHYVSVGYAQTWYQKRDPQYWRAHQQQWRQGNYGAFDNQWHHDHQNTMRGGG
jgi:hypothetical protein